MTPQSLVVVCCLALAPGLALAGDRGHGDRGGGHSNKKFRGGHHGGPVFHGGNGHKSHRRHGSVNVYVPAPRFRPNFGVRIYGGPRFQHQYRSPRVVIRFGNPGWRSGSWYYGFRGGNAGWWWGVNNTWYSYSAPVYPYPVAAPLVAEPAEEAPVNYYCRSAGQYYPQVADCAEEWEVIAAQPAAPPL
jgi:hypothetical protein